MPLAHHDGRDGDPAIAADSDTEIRDILGSIAGLIADTDRRQSEAFASLQQRIEALGAQAHSVRARLPAHYQGAFARIEDGLQTIATMIAAGETWPAATTQQAPAPAQHVAAAEPATGPELCLVQAEAQEPAAAVARASQDPIQVDLARFIEDTAQDLSAREIDAAPSDEAQPLDLAATDPTFTAEGSSTPDMGDGPTDADADAVAVAAATGETPTPAEVATAKDATMAAVAQPMPATVADDDATNSLAAPLDDVTPSLQAPLDDATASIYAPLDDATASIYAPLDDATLWAPDQAEALTRLYETDAGSLAARPAAAPAGVDRANSSPAMVATSSVPTAVGLVANGLIAAGSERDWLERKFAEIAERVETSLAEMRPQSALLALDDRFEQLELRIGRAFEDIALQADPERIQAVEGHIAELARQIGEAHDQFGRLDGIEQQLVAVMDKLSDTRLDRLLDEPNAGQVSIDVEAIAAAAADRVADRFAAVQPNDTSAEAERIEELRELLAAFIAERRQGEEHTAGMLDTMQQAMIRLLDRVEAIEQETPGATHHTGELEIDTEPSPVTSDPVSAATVEATAWKTSPQAGMMDVILVATEARQAGPETTTPTAAPATVQATPPAPAAAVTSASSEPTREKLIADVRKAMQLAAAEAARDAEQATKAAPAGKSRRTSALDQADAPTAPSASALGSRRMMLVVIGLLFSASAAYLVLPRVMKKPAPAAIERSRVVPAEPGAPAGALPTPAPAQKGASVAPGDSATVVARAAEIEPPESEAAADASTNRIDPAAAAPIVTGSLPGIALQQTGPLTPRDAARLQQQETMAQMSSRLGQAQARAQAGAAPALPTVRVAAPATDATAAMGSRIAMSELPPALVGPLSLRTAAVEGDPSAEFEVAARYAEGKGVKQDFGQALRWYQRSAARGFAPAQYRLATLYERGLGAEADPVRARTWYLRAAEQGHVKAMHNLAVISAGPASQAPDYTTAAVWFERAAEMGLSDSQYNLAILYETGLGVSQDVSTAYRWFSLAARKGDKEALRRRDLLKLRLAPADLQAAEATLADWQAKMPDRQVNDARLAGEAWKLTQRNSGT